MGYKVVVLPGDGVGPEVVREGIKVLKAVEELYGLSFDLVPYPCGGKYYQETGQEWPDQAFDSCKSADATLLGAIGYTDIRLPNGDLAGVNVLFGLRFGLDLYANVRPCKLYPNVRHKVHDRFKQVWDPGQVDMVIVRENTEGLYVPARGWLKRGGVEELTVDNRIITRKGCERVIQYAFELSRKRQGAPKDGKRRVTCIDKSNVTAGCQLFRKVYDEVAARYPGIERDYALIDAFTQWLIKNPEFYDVAVTTNMFGDIVTDLASVLQGGMGMAASGNIGDRRAMFEPVHGSVPKYEGQDKVNPFATILAVHMMLGWLGETRRDKNAVAAGRDVEAAVEAHLKEGKVLTYDLGGKARTSQVGDAIVARLRATAGKR